MIIRQLTLREFGKFKERVIELHPNMSLVYGREDSGKTTLLAFIRCMLYGMDLEDRRYIPLGAETCAGSMILETAEKTYQIDRNFVMDTIQIKDVSTNQEIANPEVVMKAIMASVSREDFECVFGLRQQKVTYNDVHNLRAYADAVQKRISGSHLDEQIDHLLVEVQECREKIDPSARSEYDKCVEQLDCQQEELIQAQNVYDELKQDLIQQEQKKKDATLILDVQRKNLKDPLRKLNEEIDRNNRELHRLKFNLQGKRPTEAPAVYSLILFLLGLIGMVTYMIAFRNVMLLAGSIAGGVLGLIGYVFFSLRYNRYAKKWNERAMLSDKLKEKMVKQNDIEKQLKNAEREFAHEEEQYNQLQEQLSMQSDELDAQKDCALEWKKELNEKAAYLRQNQLYEEKAKDLEEKWKLLCENRKYAQAQMNRVLMNMASWYLSMFTDSRYDNLKMNGEERLSITVNGKEWNLEYMGQSTIALCALSIQLAVADIVWKSDFIPIVMDETLGDFSDNRVKNIIRVLKKNGRQVILLSGHQNCLDFVKQ